MYNLLKTYQKKLTNLTSGNRSLLLRKLSSDNDIDLQQLDYVDSKPAFALLEEIISGKKEIKLCDFLDSRDKHVNQSSKHLHSLWRKDKLIKEERGTKDLYIGYPFVRGKLSDGSPIHCPIVFFPVDIELVFNTTGKGQWKLIQRKELEPAINKSFLLAYSYFNGINIADELLDYTFDEDFEDSLSFKNFLYQFLKNSPLEINFNPDLFQDKLQHFEAFTAQDFDTLHEPGKLKLFPEAVLGFFPQAGSYLAPDYDTMLASPGFSSIEDFLVTKKIETSQMDLREENLLTPFAMDASQEDTIKMVKSGNSIVVQGPPGTGKSQLICNLVCDFISKGKNVLVICQKRAALDVVYQRLSTNKIEHFTALVHDFKNDRKQLYEQISTQIDLVDDYKLTNNALDTIWLEREFLQVSRNIDRIAGELDNFRKVLFDESAFGISAKTLYLESTPGSMPVDLREESKLFNINSLKELISKFKSLIPYSIEFENDSFLWKDRISFKDLTYSDFISLKNILEEIVATAEEDYRKNGRNTLELAGLHGHHTQMSELKNLLSDDDVFFVFLWWFKQKKNVNAERLISKLDEAENIIKNTRPEMSIPANKLDAVYEKVSIAVSESGNLFGKLRWNLFSKDKQEIKQLLSQNNLSFDLGGLQILLSGIKSRIKLEKLFSELSKFLPLDMSFKDIDLQSIEKLLNHFRRAVSAHEIYLLPELEFPFLPENKQFVSQLKQFIQHCSTAHFKMGNWQKSIPVTQIKIIVEDIKSGAAYKQQLEKSFDKLVEYDKLLSELSRNEKDIFYKCFRGAFTGTHIISPENFVVLVENSFYLGWIEQMESRNPVLRGVSTYKISQWETELQDLVLKKQQLSNDILLLKIRERTYKNIEYNRLNNRTTYRDLKHQATKKKKIWKLRKLLSEYKTEVFDIIPCWLASPETVSAIFPMEELFDLVIFDEASQCFAEKGLPAFYRARQIVITGDDKQLPPNDLYQPRWEQLLDDEELNPDTEMDSLLNLAGKYLPQTKLTGHYRSKSLELINFSNHYFYRNSLQLLPDFNHINTKEPSIKYINVHGLWSNQTNIIEAEEVVKLVTTLSGNQPGKSIGVVTFNARQRELIADLLEQYTIDNHIIIPSTLFVKNIENVQGDERDIIIFSVGYAPDKSGKMQMQFGSLNQQGGENRLNVAVTRAKEKIYVVSSIEAAQLKTEDTLHEGPKLLKLYLEYARNVSLNYPVNVKNNETKLQGKLLKDKISAINPAILADNLPFADAVVKQDGQYKKLILTDDNLYYNALSAKEIHAYQPLSLKAKNWEFQRLYSRNFWIDKEKLIQLVKNT